MKFLLIAWLALVVAAPAVAVAGPLIEHESVHYRRQGRELQAAGRVDEAIDAYAKAVLSDPGSPAAHTDLGVMYETKGWSANAEAEYLRALQLNSNDGPAHTNLALLYEQQGRIAEASPHWRRRVELGPADAPWVRDARERLADHGISEPTVLRGAVVPPSVAPKRVEPPVGPAPLPAATKAPTTMAPAMPKVAPKPVVKPPMPAAAPKPVKTAARAAPSTSAISRQEQRRIVQIEVARRRAEAKMRRDELERQQRAAKSQQQAAQRRQQEVAQQQRDAERRRREAERQQQTEARRAQEAAKQRAEAQQQAAFQQRQAMRGREQEAQRSAKQAAQRRAQSDALLRRARTQPPAKAAALTEQAIVLRKRAEAATPMPSTSAAKAVTLVPPVAAQKPVAVSPAKPAPVAVRAAPVKPPKPRAAPAAPASKRGPVTPITTSAQAKALEDQLARERQRARDLMARELYQRGVMLYRQQQYEQAAEQFQRALEVDPNHQESQQYLRDARAALTRSSATK